VRGEARSGGMERTSAVQRVQGGGGHAAGRVRLARSSAPGGDAGKRSRGNGLLQSRQPGLVLNACSSPRSPNSACGRRCVPLVAHGKGLASRRVRSCALNGALRRASASCLTDLREEIWRLKALLESMSAREGVADKVKILKADGTVSAVFDAIDIPARVLHKFPHREQLLVYSLLAIKQQHVLASDGDQHDMYGLRSLLDKLDLVQQFYDSIGGIIGYHLKVLELIVEDTIAESGGANGGLHEQVLFPHGCDISEDNSTTNALVVDGVRAIPHLAELYPVGGSGDRLGLIDEATGQALPTALLPYCGRSLLEGLIRDVQAREYLYYRLFGERHCTPIAIMTSEAKNNSEHIARICEESGWFGRGKESFCLFKQPLVPLVDGMSGKWVVSGKFEILMKPSGHGAVWKLMHDKKVLEWFAQKGRKSALVRQISNPLAATDTTMLALAGKGTRDRHSFGFASCERKVGASEGCNVVKASEDQDSRQTKYAISCVEYTEFDKYNIKDCGTENSQGEKVSRFPANTNIIFFCIRTVLEKLEKGTKLGRNGTSFVLPGIILNRNKPVPFLNRLTGEQEVLRGGRLECSMQSLADVFKHEGGDDFTDATWLPTFLLFNKRRKVTSSAKKRFEPKTTSSYLSKGQPVISQTPEGSFYDLMQNAHELLTDRCGMNVPPVGTAADYLRHGPSFIFLFHPALGPLWSVMAQKIRGGSLRSKGEIVLEVAELAMEDVHVDGSLIVEADDVLGSAKGGDGKGGRCRLTRVNVHNKGIDRKDPANLYWKHEVSPTYVQHGG